MKTPIFHLWRVRAKLKKKKQNWHSWGKEGSSVAEPNVGDVVCLALQSTPLCPRTYVNKRGIMRRKLKTPVKINISWFRKKSRTWRWKKKQFFSINSMNKKILERKKNMQEWFAVLEEVKTTNALCSALPVLKTCKSDLLCQRRSKPQMLCVLLFLS